MKKAAVIGLGTISSIHVDAILNNPDITLVGVCDIDESKKEAAPEGVPFFTDYKEMIRTVQPDVAHICLPHYLHVPVSEEVASMGVHVFCEKPVALNYEQALAFADFEAAHPEIHMGICLQNRYNESVEALKEIIESGTYGAIKETKGVVHWFRGKNYYEEAPWRGKMETAGGGCMINQAVHTLDLLYYLGGEISDLRAIVGQLLDYDIEVEDTVAARLHYANGAHGMFLATIANYKNENVEISVQLEKADFLIQNNILYRIEDDGSKTPLVEDTRMPGTKFYYGASHRKVIGIFYDALEKGNQEYLHIKDAVMSIRLIDTILEAGKTGSCINV